MRVLLITPYFPPQPAVASLRTYAFARAFADAGDDVAVLTTAKRPDQTGWPADAAGLEVIEIPYAAHPFAERARRLSRRPPISPSPPPSNVASPPTAPSAPPPPSRLRRSAENLRSRTGVYASLRMPDLTDAWIRPAVDWAAASNRAWDIVISSSGPYTAHLVALALIERRIATRWIADFRDLWIDNHLARGLFPFTLRERRLHARCLSNVSAVTTVSTPLADGLRRRLRRPEVPVEVIYNGFEPAETAKNAASPDAPDDHAAFNLVYTGTLYPEGQDPRPLLRAMADACHAEPDLANRVQLHVAGQRDHLWKPLAEQAGVARRLRLYGRLPVDEAHALQRAAHALLAVEWRDPAAGVLTGTVFEYLPRSAPILVVGGRCEPPPDLDPAARDRPLDSADGPIGAFVESARRGLALGSDPARIRNALLALLRNQPPNDPGLDLAGRFAPDPDRIAPYQRNRQAARLRELAVSLIT